MSRRCSEWCGRCYSNARGRSNYRGHYGYRPVVSLFKPEVTAMLKKPSAAPAAQGCSGDRYDIGSWRQYPLLWEFLIEPEYEDGAHRQLPTLMFFLHDGRLTAALNDRDNNRTAFVSANLPEGLLEALERGLEGDCLGWRPNQKFGAKKRGR